MTTSLILRLDDAEAFDAMVNGDGCLFKTLPSGDSLTLATKRGATDGGQRGYAIGWTVELPDGTFARAQFTLTETLAAQIGGVVTGLQKRDAAG